MIKNKLMKKKKNSFLIFLSIFNLLFISLGNPAIAESEISENKNTNSENTSSRNTSSRNTSSKNTNSNYGLPTHRRDGGSRNGSNSCVADTDNNNLVALIPDQVVASNASASPKLFFYIPEVRESKTLEFVLRNEADELIHEAFLTTSGKGIMSVEIPTESNSSKLVAEQKYHWYLSMICNPRQRSRDVVVEGWMNQSSIDLATKQKLNLANSITQAELYQKQGFWYDALTSLAQDNDLQQEDSVVRVKWAALLDSVGLGELSSEPFIETEMIRTSVNF